MAKGNMLLGMARGSVGDLTFARSNGQQVARARNRNPKNPRTMAQAIQRMVMATVSGARGMMREIVDHSFEGVKYGLDSLSLFSKLNMAQLRSVAIQDINGGEELGNFQFKGSSLPQINNYIVSKGSLPMTSTGFVSEPTGYAGVKITFKDLGLDRAWTPLDYLVSMNMRPGDQLTLLFVTADVQNFEQYGDALNVSNTFSWVRLVFTTDEDVLTNESLTYTENQRLRINPKILDISRSKNYQGLALFEDINIGNEFSNFGFCIESTPGVSEVRGAAAIISRPSSDGSWLRSTSYMHYNSDVFATAKDVYPSYLTQEGTTFESDRILNNALSTASASASMPYAADVDNLSIVSQTNPAAIISGVGNGAANLTIPYGISISGVSEADRTMRIKVPINPDVVNLDISLTVNANFYVQHTSRVGADYYVTIRINPMSTGALGSMTFTADNYASSRISIEVAPNNADN